MVKSLSSVFDLPKEGATFPELSTQTCRKNAISSDVKKHAEHWRFSNAAIFTFGRGNRHGGRVMLRGNVKWNGKFPEKRTTSRGWPKFSKWFSGNFPFLSILNRKFSVPFDLKPEIFENFGRIERARKPERTWLNIQNTDRSFWARVFDEF